MLDSKLQTLKMEPPILIDITKNASVKETSINKDKFLIGRGLQNELIIENVNISRTHCLIERKENQWNISDKSSNGTWLNGKLLDKTKENLLNTGDIIGLGDNVKFVFKMPSSNSINTNESQNTSKSKTSENIPAGLSDDDFINIADSVIDALEAQYESDSTAIENLVNPTIMPESSNTTTQPTVEHNVIIEQTPELTVERYEEVVTSDNIPNEVVSVVPQQQPEGEMKSDSVKIEKQNKLDFAEDELQCTICTELFINAVTLSCSHSFCKYCIMQWQRNQSCCPICRSKITMQFSTRVLDNFIEKLLETADEDVKIHRNEIIEQRQTLTSSTSTSKDDQASSSSAVASSSSLNSRRRQHPDDPIEVSSDDSDDSDNMSEYSGSNWEEEYECDDWLDYNGLPGHYYGGYGHCYSCGSRGHWANGCPSKRRR